MPIAREPEDEPQNETRGRGPDRLVEWIPWLSPDMQAPWHLEPWCKMIERCLDGGVRGLNATPIRHYKTQTTLHGIAWLLTRKPALRIILMCADHERANELGKMCRRICFAAGIGPVRGENVILDWKNEQGGGVVLMSAEQSKLGRDVDVLIFDDPITEKNADNLIARDAVDHAIAHYTARAGRAGRRGSVLGIMSRWHPDDPVGRRVGRRAVEWDLLHARAIEDEGLATERAFAPAVMSLEELRLRRAELAEQDPTERLWWAQFQGEPRVTSGELFKTPARYATLPSVGGFRDVLGVDFAYSSKTTADWFAIVALRIYGSIAYVRNVMRFRPDYRAGIDNVRSARDMYGHGAIYSYVAGPEIGAVRYFAQNGIEIQGMPARFNKRVRAQRTIDLWNAGKILIPERAPWVASFLERTYSFRGIEGDADDEIDALVSAADGGMWSAGVPRAFGSPRVDSGRR